MDGARLNVKASGGPMAHISVDCQHYGGQRTHWDALPTLTPEEYWATTTKRCSSCEPR